MKYILPAVLLLCMLHETGIAQNHRVQIVNLNNGADTEAFQSVRKAFQNRNPGYDMTWYLDVLELGTREVTQVAFVQRIDGVTNQDVVSNVTILEYELNVGDLVYLPRGVMHRGLGRVVTQVITIPGFIPGSEIGVDHHLRAINERLGLSRKDALPFNEEHSHEAVIR